MPSVFASDDLCSRTSPGEQRNASLMDVALVTVADEAGNPTDREKLGCDLEM